MAELEVDFEDDCVEWAEARGWIRIKIGKVGGYNKRGWPDSLFIKGPPWPGNAPARHVFVEFKRPKKNGGRLSEQQKLRIKELQDQGGEVYVIDSREEFYACLA